MLNELEIDYMEFLVGKLFDTVNILRSPHSNDLVAKDALDQIIETSNEIASLARKKRGELEPPQKRESGAWKYKQVFLDNLGPDDFGGEDFPSA